MKKAIIRKALFVLVSCPVLNAAAQDKNNSVCINRIYANGISEHLRSRIDSTVTATVARFNTEPHSLKITTTPSESSHQIDLNFTQGKLVSKKRRKTAYLVNLIVPVYHPRHKINSIVLYPTQLSNGKSVTINSHTNVLFASMRAKEDKLLKKYADKLYNELKDLDELNNLSRL